MNTKIKSLHHKYSIDILFETRVQVYQTNYSAFLLSGVNANGVHELKTIDDFGGKTFIQKHGDALIDILPLSENH